MSGNAADLLRDEQRLFDDTDGGKPDSELGAAYIRVASNAFRTAVNEIRGDEDLIASKLGDVPTNNQS